jgi:cell division protein FtsX
MNLVLIEHIIAVIGGIVVAVTSFIALKNDWKTPGLDNEVFKLMLALLFIGAIIAALAGVGVLGNFPKAA